MKITAHLQQSRHGIYYFRYVLPPRVLKLSPGLPREVRKSLHTREPKVAAMLASQLTLQLTTLLAHLTKTMPPEIPAQFIVEQDPDGTRRFKFEAHDTEESVRKYMALMMEIGELTPKQAADPIASLAFQNPTKEDIHKAEVKVTALRHDKWLSDVIALFGRDKLLDGSWSRKKTWTGTYAPILKHFRELICKEKREVIGEDGSATRIRDIKMGDINEEHIRKYILASYTFPANLGSTTHGKSIDAQEAALLGARAQHRTTAFKKQRMTKTFLRWARKNRLMDEDLSDMFPAEVTDRKQAPAGYVAWNDIELKKIFERDIMAGVKKYRDMIYWGPLLALYTGARTNELSQLLLSDIIEWHDHDGQNKIWCLSITDLPSEDEDEPPAYAEGEGPRVKNPSSRRIVPLHPILFTLGFWDYVDYLKGMGETRLFKDASFEEASGYGRRMSRAWREISQDLGIWKHRKKVFHSFRSTLNGRLTKVGTPLDRCELMLGHANNSTNREYYTCPEDMPIDELFRFLARVDFKLKHHPWTRPEVWGTLPEKL